MTTSLFNAYIALSKDIGDYWAGTTTGAGSATTMVDSSLMAKANDWVATDNPHVILAAEPAGSAAIYDERKVSSLDNTTGTLTTLTFAAAPGTGIAYYLNRVFSPSDMRIALVYAAKGVFPYLYTKVRNEAKRAGNWLNDGSLEEWSSTSALTNWTASASTLTQTSTTRLFIHGSYSCKLSGAAGYVGQSIANNDDLKLLRGKSVTFKCRGWSDTASSFRISIYDGTTTTYSDYHDGDSAWNDVNDPITVTANISATATEVAFRAYHDQAAAIEYFDDAQVTGPFRAKVYINDLGLALDKPRRLSYFPIENTQYEPILISNYTVTTDYIYLIEDYTGYNLRIEGYGYLDFLASGVSSTAWTATIDLDDPQIRILLAEAAVYLYNQAAGNYTAGNYKAFLERVGYWKDERERRKSSFGMDALPVRKRRTT